MQQFPEGAHVRLRSRVHGEYLHADEDGVWVSLRRRRSVCAAWRVERVLLDGATCVLLHSAAYGRYLAAPISVRRLNPPPPRLSQFPSIPSPCRFQIRVRPGAAQGSVSAAAASPDPSTSAPAAAAARETADHGGHRGAV
ncbi:unnamed protein product [Urochloa humidicola]